MHSRCRSATTLCFGSEVASGCPFSVERDITLGSCGKTQRSFASIPASNSFAVTSGLAPTWLAMTWSFACRLRTDISLVSRLTSRSDCRVSSQTMTMSSKRVNSAGSRMTKCRGRSITAMSKLLRMVSTSISTLSSVSRTVSSKASSVASTCRLLPNFAMAFCRKVSSTRSGSSSASRRPRVGSMSSASAMLPA